MADQTIRRFIRLILDRSAAKQAGQEMEQALAQAGQQSGQSFLRELRAQFDRRMAELREQLARGLIDEQEFRKRADEAAREFNRGLLQNIERLRREGQLTDREFIKLTRSLKNVGDEGEKSAGRIRAAFSAVRGFIAGAFAFLAARGIGRFFADAVRNAEEAASVWDVLAANVENAGVAFEAVRPEIEAAAAAVTRTTQFDSTAFALALSELVSITGDYARSIRAMSAVLDLAAARHMDLDRAAQVVGRAMIGQTEQLRRFGIVVREGADAVAAIREQFRGAAEKEGAGLAGTLARIRNAWNDVKQAVGEALLTGDSAGRQMNALVDVLVRMEGWIRRNASAIQTWVDLLAQAGGFIANLAADWARLIDPLGSAVGDAIASIQAQPGSTSREFLLRRLGVERRELQRLEQELAQIDREALRQRIALEAASEVGISAITQRDLDRLRELEQQIEASRRVIAFLEAEYIRLFPARRPGEVGGGAGGGGGAGSVRPRTTLEGPIQISMQPRAPSLPAAEKLMDPRREFDLLTEAARERFSEIEQIAENAAFGIAGAFQDAFGLIIQDLDNVGEAAEALGRGIAGAFLGGLAQYASGKIAENIALAAEEFAKGQAAAASIVFAPAAPLHYAAAKSHLLAAAKWSVLAGLAGAAQSAVAGGGRGGLSGGVPTGATDVGGRLIERERRGPEVHIYIDPLDPANPVYQRNVAAASQMARERYGEGAIVHVHPRTRR